MVVASIDAIALPRRGDAGGPRRAATTRRHLLLSREGFETDEVPARGQGGATALDRPGPAGYAPPTFDWLSVGKGSGNNDQDEGQARADTVGADAADDADTATPPAPVPAPPLRGSADAADDADAVTPGPGAREADRADGGTEPAREDADEATPGPGAREADRADGGTEPAREDADEAGPGAPRAARSRWGRRRLLGAATFTVGTLVAFLLMANSSRVPRGPVWGGLAILVATCGLLDLLGLFRLDLKGARPIAQTAFGVREGEPSWTAPRITVPLSLAILVVGIAWGGFPALPYTILAALAALLPSALYRPGLLVFVVVSAMYLPWLGTYGLWDPWETHYGEVTREILARDDWISLWWAQENWFWSKPILIFWSEALSMAALGVNYLPDANPMHPEWALRIPHFLMSLGAVMAVYASISRIFTRRAGVLAALVLATMPHFFLLAHQAITDIPFVANMTVAMSLFLLAVSEDPLRQVRTYRIGSITFCARHAVIAALFIAVAPQALYLISRNITLVDWSGFAWHGDQFMFGSAGNHGVPGNADSYDAQPFFNSLAAQPIVQGLIWVAGLATVIVVAYRERRAQGLYMMGFYLFCALAFMGKGIPGFALPGLIALFYLIGSGRWSLLLDGRLRIAIGALIVTVVGMPWYVAMYIRHGPPFTDRFLIHDHINRLAAGVHGDTGSIAYFLEQLGTALFPWVALVPAAIALWLWSERLGRRAAMASGTHRSGDLHGHEPDPHRRRRDAKIVLALWFVSGFTLFSAMITKFHHYIFPVVPAAAILVGLVLDRLFGLGRARTHARAVGSYALGALSAVPLVLGVAGLWGDVRGVVPTDLEPAQRADWVLQHPWQPLPCIALILLGLVLALAAWWLGRSDGKPCEVAVGEGERDYRAPVAILLVTGAILLAFVGRDLSWVTDGRPQGYERLIQLFIYNYGRPWPEQFDYRPILTGFAVISTLLLLVASARWLRPIASRALLGLALFFTVWTLDVYIVDLSPHWSQRELVKAYYEARSGPEEPLVAWQMNWKGENFYTGNRVSVFVDLDNQKIRTWIDQHEGQRTFVLMEHTRLNSFRGLVHGHEIHQVTDKWLCNKFVLIEVTL